MKSPILGGRTILALSCAIALALCLRLLFLGHQSLWFDEVLGWYTANRPILDLLQRVQWYEQTPPLHHLVIHFWMKVAGDSAFALRLPSVALSLLAIAVIFRLTRHVAGTPAAIIACLFCAAAPFQVAYAQEARCYALLMFLTACSADAAVRLYEGDRSRGVSIVYVVSSVLAWYTHIYAGLMILGWNAGYLLIRVIRNSPGGSPVSWGRWTVLNAIVLLGTLPYFPTVIQWQKDVLVGFWIEPFGVSMIARALATYAGSWFVASILCALAAAGAWRHRRDPACVAMLALIVFLVIIPVLVSLIVRPMFVPRYGIGASVAMFVLAGVGASLLCARWVRSIGVVGILILGIVMCLEQVQAISLLHNAVADVFLGDPRPPKADWRTPGAYLRTRMRPGDIAVLNHRRTIMMFDYFVRRADVRRVGFDGLAVPVSLPLKDGQRVWLVLFTASTSADTIIARANWRVLSREQFGAVEIVELADR